MTVGLVSDTHGTLRPGALEALAGVALILHAGDVGAADVLDALARVAPVQAVRGNVDDDLDGLPEQLVLTLAGRRVRVTHGHELGSPRPAALLAAYPEDVIVYGHTHAPLVLHAGARLVVNPGSAGPPRFRLRPALARLRLGAADPHVELVSLP